jgi:hypothetical protein
MESSTSWIRDVARFSLLGAVAGAIVLGVGGRLAMWIFAITGERSAGFTLGGSLTVVFGGATTGLIGALILFALRRRLPKRGLARGLVYGIIALAVFSPGIRPPQPLTFALFAPLFLGYGLLLSALWKGGSDDGSIARPQ